MKIHTRQRFVRLLCGLFLVLLAVPVVLTWWMWRREYLNRALITAIQCNEVQTALRLLDQGADANALAVRERYSFRQRLWDHLYGKREEVATHTPTALQVVFADDEETQSLPKRQEPLELVRALIGHGANVNVMDEWGVPVVVAADVYRGNNGENNVACVRLLLEAGADVNAQTRNGMSLLLCAIKGNKRDMAQLLLSKGAKCQINGENIPALLAAKRYGNSPGMRGLLRQYGYKE